MIVGFVGFINSGKGTAGDILANSLGFKKESFAKPVKDVTSAMFGWNRDLLEGDTKESREFREAPDVFWSKVMNRQFTPREAMQKIGTEVGRDIFLDDFWIRHMERRLDPNLNYVITDVRFPNEINFIHYMGGKVFEIQRGENPMWYNGLAMLPNKTQKSQYMKLYFPEIHESEWAWIGNPIDGIIYNNTQITTFKDNIIDTLTFHFDESIINTLLHNGELK